MQRNVKDIVGQCVAVLIGFVFQQIAHAGWQVQGTKVLDPKGNQFIFRGINHGHAWQKEKTAKAMRDIAATGANSIRVVLSNGGIWKRTAASEVEMIIDSCKKERMLCVLEIHDSTGFGDKPEATNISNAVDYWVSDDIKKVILGQEDYVVINIANEPYGSNTSPATFTDETSAAIKRMRQAGLTHLIVVDGPVWGQDGRQEMRDNAAAIFAADPLRNILFSVHMYEYYSSANAVEDYLKSFHATGHALIVGEFGTENNGHPVDVAAILKYSHALGVGYMGWSWSGNASCCIPLDIAINWDPSTLSKWGNLLINSENGIKATSKIASIYTREKAQRSGSSSSSDRKIKNAE